MLRFKSSFSHIIKIYSLQFGSCSTSFMYFVDWNMHMRKVKPYQQFIVETTTTAASTSGPPWHMLPDDILPIIFKNLWIGDRVRSRLVCKSWQQILTRDYIPKMPEAPWQILSNDSYRKPESCLSEIRFRSLSEQRIYHFQFNNPSEGGWWCCGSSGGWLLIVDVNADVFLWQPLSSQVRKLPPLSTLPFFDEYTELEYIVLDTSGKIQDLQSVIHRVEVFSMDSNECIVAVIFKTDAWDEIAMCTPQEETWKILGGGDAEPCYNDILYQNADRELVALVTNIQPEHELNLVLNNEILLTDCRVPVRILVRRYNILNISDAEFPCGLHSALGHSQFCQLVESTVLKKVMIVFASLDCVASEKDVVVNSDEPIVSFKCQQTTSFSVHVLDLSKSLKTVPLESIGAETIFLGAAGSFSTQTVEGIEADCIYFATDDAEGLTVQDGTDKNYVVRQHGVFSLQQDRMLLTDFTTIRHLSGSKVGWFTPQL